MLDEIEKAHPDTFNTLLQVLDEGRLTDNKGRYVDFKNTVIIMTSNMGSDIIYKNLSDNMGISDMEQIKSDVMGAIRKTLKPEFLNRIDDIIVFSALNIEDIKKIVRIQLRMISSKLSNQNIIFDTTDEAIEQIAHTGYDIQYGARPLKRVIQKDVLNQISKKILLGEIKADTLMLLDAFDNKLVIRNQNLE